MPAPLAELQRAACCNNTSSRRRWHRISSGGCRSGGGGARGARGHGYASSSSGRSAWTLAQRSHALLERRAKLFSVVCVTCVASCGAMVGQREWTLATNGCFTWFDIPETWEPLVILDRFLPDATEANQLPGEEEDMPQGLANLVC